MLVEELLRPILAKHHPECMEDLQEALDDIATQCKTSKLWVYCLIKPLFTVLKYTRAERESAWSLHGDMVKKMIHLFFAAGHYHYARYALYYVRSMESMPDDVRLEFMKGQHTIHHGTESHMAIETTFMRYGQSGITEITPKPETVKTWAYSLHACNSIVRDLNEIRDKEPQSAQTHHKEEMTHRKKNYEKYRKALHDKLEVCINPLDLEQHRACERCRGNCDSSSSQCRQCNTRRKEADGVV